MQAARLRLIVAALLFTGWIGWLAYLAATTTKPIILSRPQFLFSSLDVIAQVDAQDHGPVEKVLVKEVHWPPGTGGAFKGKTITVTNLADCDGWDGPGEYILPLEKNGDDLQVTKVPDSPGFPNPGVRPNPARYRIYQRTPDTMRQLESIQKPDHSVKIE